MPRMFVAAALAAVFTLPALAQEKPVLTVYTYSSFSGEYGPGGTIKERFEAECGCTLEWTESDDAGTLLSRLKLEGKMTRADVVLGLDNNLIAEARASDLFAPHGVDLGKLDLPVAWSDDTFVPFDWGWFAFVYDSTKLASPPESFEALVSDPDAPSLIIEDPRTSSPGLGLLLWVRALYGDEAPAVWEKLRPHVVTVTRGWSEAYGLFLKGEADMVLSYTTSPAYHIGVEDETRYKAAAFSEGHYLQVEVAAMTKSTDQPELAKKFLAFMLSDPFQSAIPEGNWMYPAKAPADGLPESFKTLATPEKSLLLNTDEIREGRSGWIDEWLAAMSGS